MNELNGQSTYDIVPRTSNNSDAVSWVEETALLFSALDALRHWCHPTGLVYAHCLIAVGASTRSSSVR